jgi:transcriptional regulator with XRE-family HTH domain
MARTGRPALPVEEKTFGAQLREARKAAGYPSAQAFADALNIERPTVNRWEANKVGPPPLAMAQINQLLGTNFPIVKQTKKKAAKKTVATHRASKKASKEMPFSPSSALPQSLSATATAHGKPLTPEELERNVARLIEKHDPEIEAFKRSRKRGGKKR